MANDPQIATPSYSSSGVPVLDLLREARDIERERCARIADKHSKSHDPIAAAETAEIAAEIRSGPENGESTAPKTQPEAND